MEPRLVEPADAAAIAATLKWASDEGLAVVIRGAGTKQPWAVPDSHADVVLSTLGLSAPVDHVPGDLVATVPAGAAATLLPYLPANFFWNFSMRPAVSTYFSFPV